MYVLSTGCQWRAIPKDLPPRRTVYEYFHLCKHHPVFAAKVDPKPPSEPGKVTLMEGERVVFIEETNPQQYVKLVASGDVDETLLDALQDYVKRQKKRLGISEPDRRSEDSKPT